MPEVKKIRVREAKPRDIGLFRKLWKEFLNDQMEAGSWTLHCDENLEIYENAFNLYVNGDLPGVVLFTGDYGVLMWGDSGSKFKLTDEQKVAIDWGTFVQKDMRERGVAKALRDEAKSKLKEMGFTGVLAEVGAYNKEAVEQVEKAGFKPFYNLMLMDLKD